jgi:hypothetical protein
MDFLNGLLWLVAEAAQSLLCRVVQIVRRGGTAARGIDVSIEQGAHLARLVRALVGEVAVFH